MRTSAERTVNGASATRVVIIDDHEIFRAACRALLRTEGMNVVADLGTSDEVLAAVGALRPDMAIIDVTPATGTSFAIARRLRALAAPPIVILTSSAERGRFGTLVNGYPFLAKADISATAIAALGLPTRAEPDSREP